MLAKIKDFFRSELQGADEGAIEHQKQLACAALLIEVAIVDHEFDADELGALTNILQQKFGISAEECHSLAALAQAECEQATSLYQFTQLVNDNCNQNDKFELVKGMWTIAYADGDLDKYEEYVIRKVSELIYVSHSDFIRAKHAARPADIPRT
ncbi:TerB family tellurite resistance protein [Teredinibacter waterburyi]|uniref:tellurite resistance TerB family protein n=1 Tax=Teredinibacter waterburyi TaxID=1500538 RepID=UPI00165F4642|nr:TerB family tellurite resistance protein [Teredinibacter waterburyi]